MDINLKRNEKTYIISVDYRRHSILSCYANNTLTYKIDLSSSLLKTICNCNRNLEYLISKYRQLLKGGE